MGCGTKAGAHEAGGCGGTGMGGWVVTHHYVSVGFVPALASISVLSNGSHKTGWTAQVTTAMLTLTSKPENDCKCIFSPQVG